MDAKFIYEFTELVFILAELPDDLSKMIEHIDESKRDEFTELVLKAAAARQYMAKVDGWFNRTHSAEIYQVLEEAEGDV